MVKAAKSSGWGGHYRISISGEFKKKANICQECFKMSWSKERMTWDRDASKGDSLELSLA